MLYSESESDYFAALKKRALFENQIAVLVGVSPSELRLDPMPLKAFPPAIPASAFRQQFCCAVLIWQSKNGSWLLIMRKSMSPTLLTFPRSISTGVLDFLANNFIKTLKNHWLIGSNVIQILFDGGGRSSQCGTIYRASSMRRPPPTKE